MKDSGSGMDAPTQARVFEPFFTTKEVGKGTGLGLATVFGIVKQAGGAISVSSKPGQGTTFRVHLRRTDDVMVEAGATPRLAAHGPTPARAQTIIVVEDEAAVRNAIERVLQRAGCAVTAFASGREALRHIERERANVDLLVTDIVMPDMRGTELAREAKMLSPSTKVLFMSGYADLKSDETLEHPLLRKPFPNADVLEQVDALLHP